MLGLAISLVVTPVLPASASATTAVTDEAVDGPSLEIDDVVAETDGTTTLTLTVSGLAQGVTVGVDDISVVDDGVPVEQLAIASIEQAGDAAAVPAVVLAIDTSGSTADDGAIDVAKDAAAALARDVTDNGGLVGLVRFADGVTTVSPLTSDGDELAGSIEEFDAANGTALYDGISRAVRIADEHDGPKDVIVFSDGEDTTSASRLQDVTEVLDDSDVDVTVVRLRAEEDDPALDTIATVSGGEVIRVAEVDDLLGAFEAIAASLRNRLRLTYVVEPADTRTRFVNITATYTDGTDVAEAGVQIPNPRLVRLTPPMPVVVDPPALPMLATGTGLAVGIGAAAIAVFLLVLAGLDAVIRRRRVTRIGQRMAVYDRGGALGRDIGRTSRTLSSRAADVVDVIPRPPTLDARLGARIEQADWPMRVGEFVLLTLVTALSILVLVSALNAGPWWVTAVAAGVGLAAPFVVLQVAVRRRQHAFSEQLPDVLQVIGSALRAGHTLDTAVEGAAAEVEEPAAAELRRASVEVRLGRPMEQALLGVARRTDSEDLTWVVGALSVQREVGGNLTEVLANVATTLRARASVRRQVQALSAEGRLSANVIATMPALMFLVLTVISPDYIAILFDDRTGIALTIAGLVLLLAGIVWLRRLVRPQF